MTDDLVRIDGWKGIANHFRRNRSTVMRWAEAGDFPLRRVPGKRNGSVWAYAHELDAWLARVPDKEPFDRPASAAPHRLPRRDILAAMAGVLALIAVWPAVSLLRPPKVPSVPTPALPDDPVVADMYLQARDDWSTRTPDGLRKSISEYGVVTSRDPGFAPGYAGLADAYLLSYEFDVLPAAIAYAKAEAAAKAALALDPNSSGAHRALGFIEFWSRHDLRAARSQFARALSIAPDDAQSHFWLANILNEAGSRDEGLREMRIARALDPGSRVIQADYNWALWQKGPGDPGLAELKDLAAHGPPFPLPHRFLASIYLSKGDVGGYLDESEAWAGLQKNPVLTARVAKERAVSKIGGAQAVLKMIARQQPGERILEGSPGEWPTTAASLLGDRALMLELTAQARNRGEHWPTWRRDQSRYAKWSADRDVADRLDRLAAR